MKSYIQQSLFNKLTLELIIEATSADRRAIPRRDLSKDQKDKIISNATKVLTGKILKGL